MKRATERLSVAATLILVLFVALGATRVAAQDAPQTELTVGVYVSPPFVEDRGNGAHSGMAIELWETVAEQLGLTFHYTEYPTFGALVRATASGEVDAAITNLTITRDRAETIAFTQPWYDAGLRIMVPDQGGGGFRGVLNGLQDAGHLRAYAWLLSIIVLATIGLTLFDRRFDPDHPRRWRDGVAESFYHVMSIVTSGRIARKNLFGWVGRIWQGLWLAFGVAVVAYVTSTVTSVMTTLSLTNQITGLDDLNNQLVAVMSSSAQEEYARSVGLRVRGFGHLDEAVAALLEGEVAAIIDDAPVLEYYQHTHSDQPLEIVGRLFERQKYGFALPLGSPLTRPLTLAILAAIDADQVDELKSKYFGMEDY